MKKINTLSVVSLVLTLIALATFFMSPVHLSNYGLILFISPAVFYFVTLPLITVSLITSAVAIYKVNKKGETALPSIIAVFLYLLFLVFTSTFLSIDFLYNVEFILQPQIF